jgi:hypothetical protein
VKNLEKEITQSNLTIFQQDKEFSRQVKRLAGLCEGAKGFSSNAVVRLGGRTYSAAMKLLTTAMHRMVLTAMAIAVGASVGAQGADATALELIKEGNRYVGEQAKDKVVQIRSEKSVASLTPVIWYVVYYDTTATLKAVEVKFAAGKMATVKRPFRLLEPVTGGDTPLDREKLKVDSDEAIKTAMKDPLLENIKVTATQLKLEKVGEGVLGRSGIGEGVWKVKLWAAKLRDATRDADIGEVWISAADGKVIKSDLHINRLD